MNSNERFGNPGDILGGQIDPTVGQVHERKEVRPLLFLQSSVPNSLCSLDSPAAYVLGLSRLFSHAQLLDEHTRALSTQPASAAYAAFPSDVRIAAEAKLRRSSEFFASVVLTFVVRDLSQLLDKYAKKCEKWLAE